MSDVPSGRPVRSAWLGPGRRRTESGDITLPTVGSQAGGSDRGGPRSGGGSGSGGDMDVIATDRGVDSGEPATSVAGSSS